MEKYTPPALPDYEDDEEENENKENQGDDSTSHFSDDLAEILERVMDMRAFAPCTYTFCHIHKTIMIQIKHPMVSE